MPASPTFPDTAYLLHPNVTSLYDVSTSTTKINVQLGRIKNVEGDEPVITTMVTFAVPHNWAGKRCKLNFKIDFRTTPKRIDVFTSLQPITGPASESQQGNHRNEYVGRFVVSNRGLASWELTSNKGPEFCCPSGDVVGYELVGVYDMGELTWCVASGSGPIIEALH